MSTKITPIFQSKNTRKQKKFALENKPKKTVQLEPRRVLNMLLKYKYCHLR